MTDYTWPNDLVPSGSSFKLQPHTGGSESPFSRTTKTYELSAPRWTCSLSFRALRGSRWAAGKANVGHRLDAIVATLKGRKNRIALWDFDFPAPRGGLAGATGNLAALTGATQMTVTGMTPGSKIYVGDYVGGDQRPHLIRSDTLDEIAAIVDGTGQALVKFLPPLSADIAANAATFTKVKAWFRLTTDDAGDNFNEVAALAPYTLQFVEDPGPGVDVTFSDIVVTYSR